VLGSDVEEVVEQPRPTDQFDAVPRQFEAAAPWRVARVHSCGTLAAADWVNDIHPTPNGFNKITEHCGAPLLRSQAWPPGRRGPPLTSIIAKPPRSCSIRD
jgi:hypothetical protein